MARVETSCWDEHLDEFMAQVGPHFARPQTCARARSVIGALIGDLPRKNAWTLAECVGEASPHGVQHLLSRAVWDEDGVAADLRSFVTEHLGRPNGILVVDETGDCKKGTATVGVQRQSPPPFGWEVPPPAPPGASRTPRSRSTSATPPTPSTR